MAYVPTTGPRNLNALKEVHVVFNTVTNMYVMQVLGGVLSAATDEGVEVFVDSLAMEGEEKSTALSDS